MAADGQRSFRHESSHVIPVLEVGGTHVTAALVDTAAGHVLEDTRRHRPLHADAPADELLSKVLECARGLAVAAGAQWGVAIPGPFDYDNGIALFTDVAKFDSLYGVDLRHTVLEGLPARPSQVIFINDAHAFTLGEWTAGSAKGHARAVGITLGTGVGSAFLADGALIGNGPTVPPQGYVHLLTFAGRPLEDTLSRRAILRQYASVTGARHDAGVDVRDIAELARDGNVAARQVMDNAFFALGKTLGPWLARFRATVAVVGGSIAGSWDLVSGPLRAGLDQTEVSPKLELARARHLEDAALLGVAWHALHHPPTSHTGPDTSTTATASTLAAHRQPDDRFRLNEDDPAEDPK